MSVAVVTAVRDVGIEGPLLTAFARPGAPVAVVRRCVDVAELLTEAAAGTAAVALVGGDLPRLDAAVVTRLVAAGVGVVALAVGPGDERFLRGIGIAAVLPATSVPSVVGSALASAARRPVGDDAMLDWADPAAALGHPGGLSDPPTGDETDEPAGIVVAVWGPAGSPGRTLLATTLAAEIVVAGGRALLADADTYGGAVAQCLGLLDDAPGLAAAARAATAGTLDEASLAALARAVTIPGGGVLPVLTGLSRPDRWPELRPTALRQVLDLARRLAPVVVVDCGFCLETDEELSYDSLAPRRNGATLTALAAADVVLAVGAADPVSLGRLVRALPDLAAAAPDARRRVVVNRVRRGPVGGDPAREIRAVLGRFAGVADLVLLPEDRGAVDAALSGGRLLAEAAPASAYRGAVVRVAREVSGTQAPARRRRWRRTSVGAA